MLIAFEGTGDQLHGRTKWEFNEYGKRSFVHRCYKRSTDPANSVYKGGPNLMGGECQNILQEAIVFYNSHTQQRGRTVNLFGYSRGAYVALCFAEYLRQAGTPVNFVGLFDAVKMEVSVSFQYAVHTVPANVRVCYHARRDPAIGSRSSWGNVGLSADSPGTVFVCKTFPGTHAAMGGFPGDTPEKDDWAYRIPGTFVEFGKWQGLKLSPQKEREAWLGAADFVSRPALQYGALSRHILDDVRR